MRIRTEKLTKIYDSRTGSSEKTIGALDVDITLDKGETIGLFGSSGSGKSTIGQMLSGLLKPTSGKIFYDEKEISYPFRGKERRNIQILFQHPEVSFNPALPLIKSMVEPYRIFNIEYSKEILIESIQRFGLHEEHLLRKPSELSGGELQRAALSRLLTFEPEVMILDEPTSMLDVISQGQIINMLREYQREKGASFVFISHNRTLCEMVCDRIYRVEHGCVAQETDGAASFPEKTQGVSQ